MFWLITRYGIFTQQILRNNILTNTANRSDQHTRATSGLLPYHFTYPERRLTMEEMLYKFIDEGKREHEEMRAFAFICDFQTTNEILFKERNNSLIELRFGVQELLKVINNTPTIDCEVKGVTTRGGKTTTQDAQNNDTNIHTEEPQAVNHDEPVESNEVLTNDQPQKTSEPVAQPSNKIQTPPIPFPQRLRKEKKSRPSAQQKNLEGCEPVKCKTDNDSDSDEPIRRIASINTPYPVVQETAKPVEVEREHLYSASANKSDEKKPELKDLPHYLEYAYPHGNKSFPINRLIGICRNRETSLLQVLEKRKGAIAWKMSDIKGISPSYCTHKIIMEDDFKPDSSRFQLYLKIKKRQHSPVLMGLCLPKDAFWVMQRTSYLPKMHDGNFPRHGGRLYGSIHGRLLGIRNFAVGAILGQRIDGKFEPIYYASKTLNNAQEHYTTTKKELLAVVFSFDKFRPYLVLSKTIVYIDHSALKYLFSKQDAKPRLIRWVLLLQGFDIEIKDKRGAKNLAADYLSRLENLDLGTFMEEEITDEFPDEHLMVLKTKLNNDEP
ncbi:reverse transcriptase domain-containing protein [Tanacetum coccineum]